MTYDDRAHATSIVSPTGLTISAQYDSRGNLIESIDGNGLKTTYTYNQFGQLRFQTSPDGQVTDYNYDRRGNINRMVDSRGNEVKTNYDRNGRIQEATSTFALNGQIYTLGMEYTYDKEGRTVGSKTSQGNSQSTTYDALGRVTSMTDVLGNVTSYQYDVISAASSNGSTVTRTDQITLPDNTPNDNSDNPKVIKKYDAANRLIAEVSPTGLETRYVYDELGRLTETILPDLTPQNGDDNPRVKTQYSAASRITAQTDIYGNWEEYFYNNLGQLIRWEDVLDNETTYTYNKGGQVESVTDPRHRTTRYVYDDRARLTETTFFDNSRYKLTYDALGRVKNETNSLNQTTTYEYDAYSQVSTVINALNERTSFEYDHRRNLIRVTDALGRSTSYKYDEYARQIETTFATGDKVSMGYDQFSRVTSVTDENLRITKYTYDNLSQLVEIEQPDRAKTKYTYDNLGRLTQIEDANQNSTHYEYDAFHRPVATILPSLQRNQTVYDQFGQVSRQTDFNGDTINYSYDRYGRLERKTFTDFQIAAVSYTYDPVTSQLKTVTDGRGVTQYSYDRSDRLAEITHPDGQSIRYGYDLLDNITSLTTSAGTTSYGYDVLNRLDTVKDGNRTLADYDYDQVGNLVGTKFANGSVESRSYDARNRLTQVTTKNVVGTVFSGFTYTLDAVGNRMKVVEHSGRYVDYTYDSLNRLTQEKITDAVAGNRMIGYEYDSVGNRLTRADSVEGLTTYIYDKNNRLTSLTAGTEVTQFTYDNNGSMLSRSKGTETVTYDWFNDGENRLAEVKVTNANGTQEQKFVYDAFGDRMATIADGVRTNYLVVPIWNLPQVLIEYDSNGQITADYTHGLGLVRSRRDDREAFYHTDGLGSTRVLTDTVGLVTDRYTYDAFGVLLEQTGTFGNSFQFAGEQRDSQTGLDYLRARYYDPSLGRFISSDPFTGLMSDPMSQHDYQYAHANPVRYTDPTGYSTLGDVLTTISLMGIGASIWSSVGYVGYQYMNGQIGNEEIYGLYGQWAIGFADGVSGGITTDVWSSVTGQVVRPKNDFLWRMGMLAGVSTSMLIGFKVPVAYTAKIAQASWLATWQVVTTGYGAGKGLAGLLDGQWEWNDVWNTLSLLPVASAMLGSDRFFGANRALNTVDDSTPTPSTSGGDNAVLGLTETKTQLKGGCFVAGTDILTAYGEKDIEEIQVGDWVIADDPTTPGEIEARRVVQTFIRQASEVIDIYIDGEVISVTDEHPFWVLGSGWVEAEDLIVGSRLQTDGETVVDIDKIERREGTFKVYNFEVEGFHTYFVSNLGVLVHNVCRLDLINETIGGTGNFTSTYIIDTNDVLDTAETFLGPGYTQLGQPDSGVFRSADQLRGFRMDNNSILGLHNPNVPHVHYEIYDPSNLRYPRINNHVPFI